MIDGNYNRGVDDFPLYLIRAFAKRRLVKNLNLECSRNVGYT